MEPATKRGLCGSLAVHRSATSRATRAPARLISRTVPGRPRSPPWAILGGAEGVGFGDVGAGGVILVVQVGDDVRPGDAEDDRCCPSAGRARSLNRFAAIVGLLQAAPLDHHPPRPVQNRGCAPWTAAKRAAMRSVRVRGAVMRRRPRPGCAPPAPGRWRRRDRRGSACRSGSRRSRASSSLRAHLGGDRTGDQAPRVWVVVQAVEQAGPSQAGRVDVGHLGHDILTRPFTVGHGHDPRQDRDGHPPPPGHLHPRSAV